MSATPTFESETENSSSINNISSLVAEQGTGTNDDGDEDIDTSSIEALDWSEADEEELQKQQKMASVAPGSIKGKIQVKTVTTTSPKLGVRAQVKIDDEMEQSMSSEGTLLSTSLLQSISSNAASDESTKKSVIENWASDVKEAVERGEMENNSDDDDQDDKTVDGNKVCRKRKRVAPVEGPMTASTFSAITTDSLTGDPLSNAPVLDEGPIWNKGPKRYRFQENRRINQKLTFGVLIAVVLAVGLGLGNLVAYNECEMEHKAQKDDVKPEVVEGHIPAPEVGIIPPSKSDELISPAEEIKTVIEEEQLDPKVEYAKHMETLTKIVKTLDNLQQKIDKFENTSRHLGGVVMMKEEVKEEPVPDEEYAEESNSLYDEQVHKEPDMWDDPNPTQTPIQNSYQSPTPPEDLLTAEEAEDEKEMEETFVLELIHGIEETIDYLRRQRELKRIRELNRYRPSKNDRPLKQGEWDPLTSQATMDAINQADEEFIRRERDELRERKILGLAEERQPEDYSEEERAEIKRKYEQFIKEYPLIDEIGKIKEQLKFETNEESSAFGDDYDGLNGLFGYRPEEDEAETDEADIFLAKLFAGITTPPGNAVDKDDAETELEEEEDILEPLALPLYPRPATIPQEEGRKNELQIEPKKDLSAPPQSQELSPNPNVIQSKTSIPQQDKVKGDDQDENKEEYRLRRDVKPENGSTQKEKREKRMNKSKNFEEDSFEGSGHRQREKKKDQYEKKYSKEKKSKEDKKKSREDKKKYGPNKDNFKEYKDNQNKWRDVVDYDDDDDDHKRKRYSSNFNRVDDRHQNHQHQQDTNWMQEQTKVRDDVRKDYGNKVKNYQNQHSNNGNGKKGKNWQMERDVVREKVRSKNHKRNVGW